MDVPRRLAAAAALATRTDHVAYGVRLPGDRAPSFPERCRALLTVLPPDALISHGSARTLWALPDLRSVPSTDRIHVTMTPRRVPPRRPEIIVHVRDLDEADRAEVDDLPVTGPERLFLDLAATASLEDLVVLGDAATRRGLCTAASVAGRVAAAAGRRGVIRARAAAALLDGRSQSPPESILRVRLAAAGYPAETQCAVRLRGLLVAHVDLGYPEVRVGVEYEGRHHAEQRQFQYDIRRYSDATSAGWRIIRAGAQDLADGSRRLIGQVISTLREAGYRGRVVDQGRSRRSA